MPEFRAHHVTQGELIERLVQERPRREALIFPGSNVRMTFADLGERSMALARGLVKEGIRPGDRVAVWSDNRPDWVALQFALARIGAVLVTVNTGLVRDEVGFLLRQSRAAMILASPGFKETEYFDALTSLLEDAASFPDLRQCVALADEAPEGFITVADLVSRGLTVSKTGVAALTANTRLDDAANIQYTSGTTGFPKGVVLTHRNLVENAYAVSLRLDVNDHDRLLLQVPLFHCFGCVVAVLGAYTHGIPLVAIPHFDPTAALQAIDVERCTLVYGVPAMFHAILGHPELSNFDTTALRTGIMAGSVCPEMLMQRVVNVMGCEGIVVAYGLTEASPCITVASPDDPIEERLTSVGRALPDVEVRVVDPATGEDVPHGETGEIWSRGPNTMLGYFENDEATAEAVTPEGWLRTGDLGTMDATGLVSVVGRLKEMIIRGGENVYPAEVEDALSTHPAIDQAAVFGIPDEHFGEAIAAALVLLPGAEAPSQEALAEHVADALAHFKRPTSITYLDALPMTASGKVQKFKLPELCGFRG
jgi:fatty-acyl-CoA synthase